VSLPQQRPRLGNDLVFLTGEAMTERRGKVDALRAPFPYFLGASRAWLT
jgi:hypothetical protein